MENLLNNRYRVLETLGSGGFGETFLAEDTHMPSKRRCVIKQLRPIQNNPQIYQLVQERFQREAAILEDLGGSTNQIPTLYAYFQSSGQFYVVQEWVEGETLTTKVKRQGLFSESAVRDLLLNLLPVLEYVHSKRIIHRDIKPDNIIVRYRDGKPVLIDFGAVRESMGTVVNSQGNPTSSIVIGTPGYMPSEQAAGRPMYSSDIYSLGMTAVYLLTGKQPQELETDPRTGEILWRSYALSVSPTLAGIIDRAIAYHPRERFATAREMLEALQTGTVSFPPTVLPTPTPATIPNTVAVSPRVQPTPQSVNQNNGNKGFLLGIVGGLMGAAVAIGVALHIINQSVVKSTPSQSDVPASRDEQAQVIDSPSPEPSETSTNNQAQEDTPPVTTPSPEPSETSTNNQEDTPPPISSQPPTPIVSETPSAEEPSSTQPEVDRPSPEKFVQDYYATINEGQYQDAWNLLSPRYQNNQRLHPQGYDSYLGWWRGQVGSVSVEQVNLVETNAETATVDALLTYFMKSGKQVQGSVRFSLSWDTDNNRWVISGAN
ncbi:protein kinase [Nostoc sp. FACHB-152]|uniref:serine/threonine-protein kinase n=1 Tax=unclassified Nostoc TaxID=2593658 RepID=UPI00168299B7|nr:MULTISPECIES: serine/threonine-protein kinase [unclassified Nostoc]MBD2446722.1 protein kinase [Nostoc sp. FACHB-152]MBD2466570.1 protein kinase [Nostoc sp. FACHB-145]